MKFSRIILITPGFTADEYDRNCLPTLQLYVETLLSQQLEVHIVALDYPFSEKNYVWKGATVHPCGGRNSRWLKPRTIWRAIRHCRRLLETPQPTLLHSFWLGWCSGIGEWVSRRKKTPHLTTLMGQDVLPPNRHRFRFLTKARQRRLVALSDFQNDIFEKNAGFRAAHVIPWGASAAETPKTLPEYRPLDVLGVGSFISLKKWDKWLKTIALARKEKPELRAELIGGGPLYAVLQQYAAQLGLTDCVRFSGDLPRPEVLKKMLETRVLLHTSEYESQGYVLTEAAMNGCRIVSTPVGIAPDMGNCADTPEALAKLVVEATNQPLHTRPQIGIGMEEMALRILAIDIDPENRGQCQ